MAAKKLLVELVKSPIACLPKQRATIKAMGLGKISSKVELADTPVNRGMITVVKHLVKVQEI